MTGASLPETGRLAVYDMRDDPLAVGDRVTWSEYFVPGRSHASDMLDLPQKAPGVDNAAGRRVLRAAIVP